MDPNDEKNLQRIKEKLEKLNEIANVDSPGFQNARVKASDLRLKAQDDHRKWTFTVITLSSAIFGASLATFAKTDLIKSELLFYVALLILAINVVHGIWRAKSTVEQNIN